MGVLEYSLWIAATPAEVWRIYVDPARISEWQTGSPVIEDVSGPGDRAGTTYVSRRASGRAVTTVVEVDPPSRIVTRTNAYLGLRFELVSMLSPDGPGTRLHLRAETRWPRGLGLVGKLVERAVLSRGEALKELANLKAIVERPGTEAGPL